jgi:mannan endo-1,4-beta-mannosidase
MIGTIGKLGQQRNKLWAFTETGLEQVTETNWWTSVIQPILQDAQLSYILVWRNGRANHYYAPYPGQQSAEDFVKLGRTGRLLFEDGAAREHLYTK